MSITWKDGRHFKIDRVKSHRPAGEKYDSRILDCYMIEILGMEKRLYHERTSGYQHSLWDGGLWSARWSYKLRREKHVVCIYYFYAARTKDAP